MYNKILVPLDGSARAEDILPHVVELASKYQSAVMLMRVVEIKIGFDGAEFMSMAGGTELAMAIEEDKLSVETYLNGVKARLKAEGVNHESVPEPRTVPTNIFILPGPIAMLIVWGEF